MPVACWIKVKQAKQDRKLCVALYLSVLLFFLLHEFMIQCVCIIPCFSLQPIMHLNNWIHQKQHIPMFSNRWEHQNIFQYNGANEHLTWKFRGESSCSMIFWKVNCSSHSLFDVTFSCKFLLSNPGDTYIPWLGLSQKHARSNVTWEKKTEVDHHHQLVAPDTRLYNNLHTTGYFGQIIISDQPGISLKPSQSSEGVNQTQTLPSYCVGPA